MISSVISPLVLGRRSRRFERYAAVQWPWIVAQREVETVETAPTHAMFREKAWPDGTMKR
jgi:hypothetical protein